jgi:hypothetical protein
MNTAAQVPQVQKFYSETPETVETNKAPEVVQTAGSGGGYNVTVNNNPTIVVNGDTPGDLEEKLEQNNQKLLREFEEITRQKNEDERRSEYE